MPSIGEVAPRSPVGPGGVAAPRVASTGHAVFAAEPVSAPGSNGPALGISGARPLTDSTSVAVSPPPSEPEPTPVAEPSPVPVSAGQNPPPTLVTGPADGGKVVTAAVSPCEDQQIAVTVLLDAETLAAGEPQFDLVVHPLTEGGSESEVHFDGDWVDLQDLVAGLSSDGSCVLVLTKTTSEDDDAPMKVEADADAAGAAETGAVPESTFSG
jgi:hypothetical protein